MTRYIPDTYKQNSFKVGGVQVTFNQTLRVPENQLNALPAGLGNFPLYKVSDFRSTTPKEWRDDAVFMPVYPQEAMWMGFSQYDKPQALIIGAGQINAISGKPFDPSKVNRRKKSQLEVALDGENQNYLVVPPQPWLDGWKAENGKVYQFVAAEMGSGQTVEGQITGEESEGGIQFIVYNSVKPLPRVAGLRLLGGDYFESCNDGLESFGAGAPKGVLRSAVTSMGLGRGGEIEQKIYPDPYSVAVWNETPAEAAVLYMVSSNDFKRVTGYNAPPTPITEEEYKRRGIPWFTLADGHMGDAAGSDVFGKLKPVTSEPKNPLDKLKKK